MSDYRVVLETYCGSKLVSVEYWSRPTTKARAEKVKRALQRHVFQPLNGHTVVLTIKAC